MDGPNDNLGGNSQKCIAAERFFLLNVYTLRDFPIRMGIHSGIIIRISISRVKKHRSRLVKKFKIQESIQDFELAVSLSKAKSQTE